MNSRSYILKLPGNPVLQALSVMAAGVVMIGAVLLGAVLLAFVLGFAVLAAIVLVVRVWWLRRTLQRSARRRGADGGRIIDVEYRVVDEQDPDERRG